MLSQSIFAQLVRMVVVLIITLYGVRQCQPLIDSLAQHATNGGCHQQNSHKHEHMDHH